MDYRAYLRSSHWKTVRRDALRRAGNKCQLCSSRIRLEVHHNSYEHLWDETEQDVVVLCRRCHAKFHGFPVDALADRIRQWFRRVVKRWNRERRTWKVKTR